LRQQFVELVHEQEHFFVAALGILIFIDEGRYVESFKQLIEQLCVGGVLTLIYGPFVDTVLNFLPGGWGGVPQQAINRRQTVAIVFAETHELVLGVIELVPSLVARFDPPNDSQFSDRVDIRLPFVRLLQFRALAPEIGIQLVEQHQPGLLVQNVIVLQIVC
jgi:hypothetical protein